MTVNALSVDVEDYFHTEAMSSAVPVERWESMSSRVERNTLKLLDQLTRHNVLCTMFFLGWVARRYPDLVRTASAAGHEIACHSNLHRAVFRLSPKDFAADTREAKETIEDVVGISIAGYRAPSFSILPQNAWAYEILAELGFSYDSSTYPIRHDFYGNQHSPRVPHRVANGRLLELPIATVPFLGSNWPIGGGAYLRILPTSYMFSGLGARNRAGERAVVYLHPWEIDPDQPRLPVGLKSRLRQYTNLAGMEGRFERLLTSFRFDTLSHVFAEELKTDHGTQAVAVASKSQSQERQPR